MLELYSLVVFSIILQYMLPGEVTACDGTLGYPCNPGKSCRHIYEKRSDANDGLYHIQTQGELTKTIPVYCDMKNYGLTMIFKIAAGQPGNAQALWKSSQTVNEELISVILPKFASRRHYKNSFAVAANWGALAPLEVHVVLFKGGKEEVRLIFDGRKTTPINWFTKSRLLLSPYSDIQSYPQNFFSIEGHQNGFDRSFYINRNYGGCHVDQGWFAVIGKEYCSWEKGSLIKIMYSKGSTSVNWTRGGAKIGLADFMAVYLR
eukprot:m.15933 g.15933  ORF g.15933 m.15933 type:complete len:262 (+) comp26639_c0_seq2:418-1203(+)